MDNYNNNQNSNENNEEGSFSGFSSIQNTTNDTMNNTNPFFNTSTGVFDETSPISNDSYSNMNETSKVNIDGNDINNSNNSETTNTVNSVKNITPYNAHTFNELNNGESAINNTNHFMGTTNNSVSSGVSDNVVNYQYAQSNMQGSGPKDFLQNINNSNAMLNGNFNETNGYNSFYNAVESSNGKKSKRKAKKINKKSSGRVKVVVKKGVAFVACAAVFGGVSGGVFNLVTDSKVPNNLQTKTTETITTEESILEDINAAAKVDKGDQSIVIPTTNVDNSNKGNLDVSDIAEGVMPSVVSITIKGVAEVDQGFFGRYQYETEGSGSGIIIGENDKELLIVTNNHVVSDANTVSVTFIDGETYEAKVKGTDADSDLAVIVVDLEDISADTMSQIQIAKIGDSDQLKVGEQVVAIGNALGYGQSVTTGIVSAKNRTNSTNSTPLIQTDAAINPGNSGGALLNMNGELIGINSSKYASTDVEGMGYAIPISEVDEILNDLINRVTREKVDESEMGYLGIGCESVTDTISQIYGVPTGVLVTDVYDGSGAKKAGIKKNYIITKLDGQAVNSTENLISYLQYYKVGEKVTVTVAYLNDGEYVEKDIEVILSEKPNTDANKAKDDEQ